MGLEKILDTLGVKTDVTNEGNKKNVAKTTNAPIYQNEGPVNSNNLTINGSSEYAAKFARKQQLELSVISGWMSPNECHEELQALNKWLKEHANG